MTPKDATRRVALACDDLQHGYAHDLCASLLDGHGTEHDCDALFRTLVLDEGYQVDRASLTYSAACVLAGVTAKGGAR